jgi:hypothetical protein
MTRDEAKFILSSYGSGHDDADPQFREAFELMKIDPELAAWFAKEQAIDSRLCRKFQAFPVPPDLKTQLLAARKVTRAPAWWRQPMWMSAAACVALLFALAVSFLRPHSHPEFADFRSYVANTARTLDHLDVVTTNLVEARQWLEAQHAPSDFLIPASLSARPSVGCRAFNWKGRHVGLVCFKMDDQKTVHLFVIDRSALRNAPVGTRPDFLTTGDDVATGSWSDNHCTYVVAGNESESMLKRLL